MNYYPGSFSRQGNVRECARFFLEKDLLKKPERIQDTKFLDIGNLFHEAAAARVTSQDAQWPEWSSIEGYRPEYREELTFLASRTEEILRKLPIPTHAVTEHQLAFTPKWEPCDWFDKQTYWRGILDVAWTDPSAGTTILDWKTGRLIHKDADRLQARQYSLLSAVAYPDIENPPSAVLVYPRFGEEGIFRYDFTWDDLKLERQEIDAFQRWLGEKRKDVLADWPATPCRKCATCPISLSCDALKKSAHITEVPQDAEIQARAWLAAEALEAEASRLKALCRAASDVLGTVILPDGRQLGVVPQPKWTCTDPHATLKHIVELGVPPEQLYARLPLTKTDITNLTKDLPKGVKKGEAREMLMNAHGKFETTTVFKAINPKGAVEADD